MHLRGFRFQCGLYHFSGLLPVLKAQDRKNIPASWPGVRRLHVLVAGLEAPLVRGYVMYSAALAGYLLDRIPASSGAGYSLPRHTSCRARRLFDAGFQMSFIASYGITAGMTLWDGPISDNWIEVYIVRFCSAQNRTSAEGSGALYRPYLLVSFLPRPACIR